MSPDPVRDVVRTVYTEGFIHGAGSERRRRQSWAFIRGVLVGIVLTLATIATALAQSVPAAAHEYRRDLTRISRSVWGANAPVASLAAQIHQESLWDADAVSGAGAKGLTQFMDRTAEAVAQQYPDLQPVALFDPRWAMRAQSRLMLDLYESFDAVDECNRFAKALAAYNGGPKWVRRGEDLVDDPGRWFGSVETVNPGKAPQFHRETTRYARSILLTLTPVYYAGLWGPGYCLPAAWRWS